MAARASVPVSGLFYGKVGYRWNNFHNFAPGVQGDLKRDYHATVYGVGAEVGRRTSVWAA